MRFHHLPVGTNSHDYYLIKITNIDAILVIAPICNFSMEAHNESKHAFCQNDGGT